MNSFEALQINFGGPGRKFPLFQFLHLFAALVICNDFESCCSCWTLLTSFRCPNGLITGIKILKNQLRVSGWRQDTQLGSTEKAATLPPESFISVLIEFCFSLSSNNKSFDLCESSKDQADPQNESPPSSTSSKIWLNLSCTYFFFNVFQCNYQAQKKTTSFIIITEKHHFFFLPAFFTLHFKSMKLM